jgi:spore germination protein GerM
VTRRLAASDSPLKETLKTLFQGTTSDEEDKQYSSAIPGGVTVRGIRVAGGIATIDLSANFEEGTGKKMMQARVYQVVYTATQYPTVTKVQILLNGKTDSDFGGEGFDLSKPLGPLSSLSPKF